MNKYIQFEKLKFIENNVTMLQRQKKKKEKQFSSPDKNPIPSSFNIIQYYLLNPLNTLA